MRRIIVLLSIVLFGVLGTIIVFAYPDLFSEIKPTEPVMAEVSPIPLSEEKLNLPIHFSHNETFYDSVINVSLTATNPEAKIYYTTDGSDPTIKSKEYKNKAIFISSGMKVKATTIKAITVTPEETSEIVTKSYVTGSKISERFSEDTLVFVLSTDPHNLYDYHYGIAIEGYLRDEYIKSDEYTGGEIDPPAPANYNMRGIESERNIYVETYDNEGKQLINQAAGVRLSGGWSRAHSQKSLKLIARNDYSEGNGMFKYPFFQNAVDSLGQPILKYDRINLRNGGNDRAQSGIRDELSQELARQAGFLDTMQARPAAIFLNSEYYGFSWLKETYCEAYLEQTYRGVKENYQIVGGEEEIDEGEDFAVLDYHEMYALAETAVESNNDSDKFTNDEIFEKFCSMVDLDNFLLYYAMEVFIGNRDWPGNNFKAWRYYPSEEEVVTNPYNDGKWRLLLFDAEFGWGLYGNGFRDNTLLDIIGLGSEHMGGTSVILSAILQRKDMQEEFTNILCDLMGGAFSTENILKTLDELQTVSDTEYGYALDNGKMDWANRWSTYENRYQIIEFAENRSRIVYRNIQNAFGISKDSDTYKVTVINAKGASAYLSSQKTSFDGDFATGDYYTNFKVKIGAEEHTGYEFDYWEINGKKHYEKEMKLGFTMTDTHNNITAVLHMKKLIDGQTLYISEIHAEGKDDWIELYNPNQVSVSTKDYYLTDDETMLNRWKIPTVTIEPMSSVVITMKNNKSIESLMKLQATFSLKEGETLILSDLDGNVVSLATIITMEKEESMIKQTDGSYLLGEPSPGIHED